MEDKLLQLYFEGKVTKEQSFQVTQWLNASEENMNYYLQLSRLYEVMMWNEPVQSKKRTVSIKAFMREFSKVAAILVLGFLLSTFFLKIIEGDPAMQQVVVPAGQSAQVVLSDGSKVWLNAGSSLQFPTEFIDGIRNVKLEGEGYFEVQANKEKPFVVSTSHYSITALGTSFNVFAYKNSTRFETALLSGKVKVADCDGKNMVHLTPNQSAVFKDGKLKIEPITEVNQYKWRDGVIYFDNTLPVIFSKLELYFNVTIKVNNPEIMNNNSHCVGSFRTRDGLEHIIKVLQFSNKFEYRKDDQKNLITIY